MTNAIYVRPPLGVEYTIPKLKRAWESGNLFRVVTLTEGEEFVVSIHDVSLLKANGIKTVFVMPDEIHVTRSLRYDLVERGMGVGWID